MGSYPTVSALRDALQERRTWIGNLAGETLHSPSFYLSSETSSVDLAVVAVSQLGFGSNSASFAQVHAQAAVSGLDLCPPEVGPQLRLQYLDQKVGEYLLIGMRSLPTADGSNGCFVVGNGGAGLLLTGRLAGPDLPIWSGLQFVFALRR